MGAAHGALAHAVDLGAYLFSDVALLIAALLLAAFLHGPRWRPLADHMATAWGWLAHTPARALVVAGLIAAIASLLVSLARPPIPTTEDEFAYLLAADTFAHGRLANPPHPLWQHFESIMILQQPTYAAKYPPGQGLALALGQVLTGSPLVGVWLSFALACSAVCWMLQGWMPRRWALLGAVLVATQPRIVADFGASYWGGAVALAGGALLFGALPRLVRYRRSRHAVLLAVGVGILANSRPYEGLAASVPAMLAWLSCVDRRARLRLAAAVVAVFAPTGVAMLYYHWRVTGDPLMPPYALHEAQYDVARSFFWLPPHPVPAYRHPIAFRKNHLGYEEYGKYVEQRSVRGALVYAGRKLIYYWKYFISIPLTIPLLALRGMRRHRPTRFAVATTAWVLGCLLIETWFHAWYAAPIVCVVFLLIVRGLRQLRLWRVGDVAIGRIAATAVIASALLQPPAVAIERSFQPYEPAARQRADIMAALQRTSERHLVLVRYTTLTREHFTWVYNDADIDHAKVIWAHEMDRASTQRLLNYFTDRTVWLLEASTNPARLSRYPPPSS